MQAAALRLHRHVLRPGPVDGALDFGDRRLGAVDRLGLERLRHLGTEVAGRDGAAIKFPFKFDHRRLRIAVVAKAATGTS